MGGLVNKKLEIKVSRCLKGTNYTALKPTANK